MGSLSMNQAMRHLRISLFLALALFALSFVLFFDFSYMGERDAAVEQIVTGNFKVLILLFNLKILLVYGLVALFLALCSLLLGLERRGSIFAFQLFVWSWFLLRAVKVTPQLFVEPLYSRGGLAAKLQVFVTDVLPLWAIHLLFGLAVMLTALSRRRFWHGLAVVAMVVAFIFPFKTPPLRAQAAAGPPNILVLGTDSLRPDHLSHNGYPRPTPNIDRLLARGANFLNARASLARTFSSFTSVLTSSFPPEHGIRHMFPRPEELRLKRPTLVEALKARGYQTALISDFAGDIFTRLGYGFERIQAPRLTLPNLIRQRSLELHYSLLSFLVHPLGRKLFPVMWLMPLNIDPHYVTNAAKRCIRDAARAGKPFFVFYFSSNCHFPYGSPYPYYQSYADREYRGRHKYRKVDMMKTYTGYGIGAADRGQIVALYDGAVRLFDDQVGEMLRFLERCGVEGNTLVVLFSDHGESLYENGYGSGHGDHLRGPHSNSMTFGVYSPSEDFGGRRVRPTVRDIDIAPTLLDLAGIAIPPGFRGRSLLPVLRGGEFSGYPVYLETELWYTPETPYIADRVRMAYPGITRVVELVPGSGEIVLKREFREKVIQAKHRGVQLNDRKYIYMPGDRGFREEWYLDERPVATAAGLAALKSMLQELLPGRFAFLSDGRVRERFD